MQRKRILFLISLPAWPEFEENREDIEECVCELRQLNVDVHEHITRQLLAKANDYDIVIVVAHHDMEHDTLVLADGALKMSDFISSLPSDFKGVLDFSSCYSATAFKAIKQRCPQCRVQASIVEVRLLQRIIIYPSLVEILYEEPETDYHEAYKEVTTAFEEFASSKDDGEDEPEMAQLGQQISSVYAPSEVKLNTPFQILVFLHYDAEREVVKVKAQRWQTNAIIREDAEIPIKLKEGDVITATLSFDSPDNANIIVSNGCQKHITLKKEMTAERFKVTVLPDFKGSGFLANIEMAKDDEPFVICAFNIDISDQENKAPAEIIAEVPQQSSNAEDLIKRYVDIFTVQLLKNKDYASFKKILSSTESNEEKLFSIRKILYNEDFLLKHLTIFLKEKDDKLSELLKKDARSSEITFDLVPALKKHIQKLQKKIESLENKVSGIKQAGGQYVTFENALLKIPSLEKPFVDLCSDIKNIGNQIGMLNVFVDLRAEVKRACKGGTADKNKIKSQVTDFLEYPHNNHVDLKVFDLFKTSDTNSFISSSSRGATMAFTALVLAMVEGEYKSIDRGKEDWSINIDKYIDFSKYTKSLRTPKNRINKLVSRLGREDVRKEIEDYRTSEDGKYSITAYYLLRVKLTIG